MNIKETTQELTARLEGKRSEAEHLNKVRWDLQKRTPDLEAIAMTFPTDRMEWDAEMDRQEQKITDSNALRKEPERILDIDPASGAPGPKRNQPAGQEVDDDLVALLPTSPKDKNEAMAQPTMATENLKRGKKMLESLETILATQENWNKELEEKTLTLEKSLGEKEATIRALEAAKDQATVGRDLCSRQLMTLRASDIMYKSYVVEIETDRDQHKAEATQLRSDLETAKQDYDRDMQELKVKHEQERREMQQRIDEAANTQKTERQAMQKRIDGSESKVEQMQQRVNQTTATHESTAKDLQKRMDEAAAIHKKKVDAMQQRIENANVTHREELGEMQQRMDAAKAAHDVEKESLQGNIESTKSKYKNQLEGMKQKIRDSNTTHENKVAEMQMQIDACNTARDEDAEAHEQELKRIRKEMEEMVNTHWAAIETEKSLHDQDKQSLETSYCQEKTRYETAFTAEVGRLKIEHADAIKKANEKQQRLGEEVSRLHYQEQTANNAKARAERELDEEKRNTALQSSRIRDLEADLRDAKSKRVEVVNQLASRNAEVQTLKESLNTEKASTVQVQESLRAVNKSHIDALSQWARLFFGPDGLHSEQALVLAISKGTRAAAQDHRPWLISESSTADQRLSEFPRHELGAVVSMLINILQDRDLEIQWFGGLIRRLTALLSQAPRVNTALIQWIVDYSNWSLSAVHPNEHVIPARAAIWALADVLKSRWPNIGHIEHSHDILQECWGLIAQHDPKAVDAEGLNAQGKVPMVLELQQDNNGSVVHIVKKPEWAWAVIVDMQRHTCAFVKEHCLREVAMGNGVWDKEVKAGNVVVHLDMSKPECVDFYMEHWVFED
ncbi:Laminin subunit alpha-2 [Colletotrichum sp. SAR11_240]|nr:Laminin subunit alpha-2 [Colletotrichum sp. SAR11_240]